MTTWRFAAVMGAVIGYATAIGSLRVALAQTTLPSGEIVVRALTLQFDPAGTFTLAMA